jgi:tetratricopeptide (TPR) repeat protein
MKTLSPIFLLVISFLFVNCAKAQSTNVPSPTPAPPKAEKSSFEYMREGSEAFAAGRYQKAIGPFQKALDLEKQDRKLEKNLWFVLIDNLAMSYGISGDLKNSRATLEYGISKEPEYPMFYYIMANTYGEESDEAGAIKYLRYAFKYKANMLDGESLPDPMTDDSFRSLVKSETFRRAIAEMKKN